jgi:predicted nucleotidyltransferase component of viral defense system
LSPGLDTLRRTLVLKGGAALLLVYGSGRATRTDLDFDVRTSDLLTEPMFLQLMAAMRGEWNAAYAVGQRPGKFEEFDDAINVGPIAFRNSRTGASGSALLQVSRRKVPPYLSNFITEPKLKGVGGREFTFPIMPLELIAAEKVFRSISTKGPFLTDLYDIGYICDRPDLNHSNVDSAFRSICDDERQKLARDKNEAALKDLAETTRKAKTPSDLFRDDRVLDDHVKLDKAKARIAAGVRYVSKLAGIGRSVEH